jgi:CheY-like chemotaxis protein
LLGGEVGGTSEAGRGSTFWFTAEFVVAADEPFTDIQIPAIAPGAPVLVVDDNATNRLLVLSLLQAWGYRGVETSGATEALIALRAAAAAGDPFEVALLDMAMPDIDGLELAQRIKQTPAISATRLILLSSLGRVVAEAAGVTPLFEAQLSKPLRQTQLRTALALAVAGGVEATRAAPATAVDVPVAPAGRHRFNILLAEDNVLNQKVALLILERLGYQADVATNGREAVAAIQAKCYDLILMDCHMPEVDGFTATATIRSPENGALDPNVPIIALTEDAMPADRARCLAVGMNDYLAKPIQAAQLAKVLAHWLPEQPVAQTRTILQSPGRMAFGEDLEPDRDIAR